MLRCVYLFCLYIIAHYYSAMDEKQDERANNKRADATTTWKFGTPFLTQTSGVIQFPLFFQRSAADESIYPQKFFFKFPFLVSFILSDMRDDL